MTATEKLRNERVKLITDMQALNAKAESENRDLNTEEKVTYERMKADTIFLKQRYERAEDQASLEKELAASRGSVVDTLQQRVADNEPGANKFATKEYRAAVDQYVRTGHTSLLRAINETGTSGVTLPTDVAAKFVLALNRGAVVRRAGASVLATNVNTTFPISSVVSGGWESETSGFATADPTITAFVAKAFKYTASTKISQEMLNDSAIDMQAFITERFVDAIAQATDDAYVAGASAHTSQPRGILADAIAYTTAEKTGAGFTAAELRACFFSLPQQYRRQSDVAWIVNDGTLATISGLVADSTSLASLFLWQPSILEGEPDKLLGKPVYSSSAMPFTVGSAVPLAVVGSMKYYQIVDRLQQVNLLRANELYAATGEVGFFNWFRTDGQVTVFNAFRALVCAT